MGSNREKGKKRYENLKREKKKRIRKIKEKKRSYERIGVKED